VPKELVVKFARNAALKFRYDDLCSSLLIRERTYQPFLEWKGPIVGILSPLFDVDIDHEPGVPSGRFDAKMVTQLEQRTLHADTELTHGTLECSRLLFTTEPERIVLGQIIFDPPTLFHDPKEFLLI